MAWPTETKEACLMALSDLRMTPEEVAKAYGLPVSTVKNWKRGVGLGDVRVKSSQKLQSGEDGLIPRLERLLDMMLARMEETVHDAGFRETSTAVGITIDKLQILRGKPTEITEASQVAVVWNWDEEHAPEPVPVDADSD